MSRVQDFLGVLKGAQIVASAAGKYNRDVLNHVWINSSIRVLLETNARAAKEFAQHVSQSPGKEFAKCGNVIKDSMERQYVVLQGIKQLIDNTNKKPIEQQNTSGSTTYGFKTPMGGNLDPAKVDISSITLKELEELIAKKNHGETTNLRVEKNSKSVEESYSSTKPIQQYTPDKINKLPEESVNSEEVYVNQVMKMIAGTNTSTVDSKGFETAETPEASKLSSVAKQRKVPATRVGRMVSFGSLFAGLGIGTINELTKGALGLGGSKNMKEALLSSSNAERIVDTLCKVRGAALKIGQILSIQDSNVVSPQLVKAFERVRQAADYMPDYQVERVMSQELGANWRGKLEVFEQKPFAAASIGQVHRGILPNGTKVAIKIQYPGVAKSIESDIDNLVGMLKIWDVFPKGFFIDNVVKVAKRELKWEVDYCREAEYTEKFAEMIGHLEDYYVPKVIHELSTKNVLTTELVPGVPLDKCFNLSYDHRRHIGESVLKLCLRELFELRCMQTDPNWSNFLYDENSRKLMLIDFGSTRFYTQEFVNNYRSVVIAAANNDPKAVLEISRTMGFLTGYESKQMEEAHVNAVMILGDLFRYEGEFDFGKQNTTKRIAQLVPTMVAHRLCPPPEEIYSIHRKLSGIFLLCTRLNIKLDCRPFYNDIVKLQD